MTDLWKQILDNLAFVGVSLAIVLGLALLARLAEHFLPEKRKVSPARRVSIIGISAAIAAVLHVLDFPLVILAPEFYKLDFSELPVLLCGFYLGPSATVVCEGVKILLKLLPAGSVTGAPKEATCRAIAEAEDMERGFYTGIFGFFNGRDLDSAVAIRFMEEDEKGMVYKSGGGITVMSRMEDEYREAIAKVYVPFDF